MEIKPLNIMKKVTFLCVMLFLILKVYGQNKFCYLIVTKSHKYECLDSTGHPFIDERDEKIVSFSNSNLGNFAEIIAGFSADKHDEVPMKNARYGLIDLKGREVLPPKFEALKISSDTGIWVKENNKWGFMQIPGRWAISPEYEDCGDFSEGMAGVKKNNRWGAVDKDNRVKIPFIYDVLKDFNKGYAVAAIKENGKMKTGLLDKTGSWKISPRYDDLSYMAHYKLWVYTSNDSCGFVDEMNSIKKTLSYNLGGIDEKTIILHDEKNKLYGFYNYSTDLLIKPQYDFVSGYSNDLAYVTFHKGTFGIIDVTGKVVAKLPCINTMWAFDDERSLLPYHEGDAWGFADLKCSVVIKPVYSEVRPFVSNRAAVKDKKSNLWGVIDRKGNWLVEPRYNSIEICELASPQK
jgi:hypothetical protein